MYAGVFLGASLLIMPLIKQVSSSFAIQGKKPFWFNIISSAIASAAAFGATYFTNNLFYTYWILSVLFLLFGIIFVLFIYKRFFKARRDDRNKQLFGGLLYGLSIVLLCVAIFSSLQYFLKNQNFMWFPTLLCVIFFFIPLLLLHTFDAAMDIPQPVYNSWQYPERPIDLPDEKENEHLYVIGFEIAKKYTDAKKTYFRAKAPEDMLLGDLYYHFVNDYNDLHSETPIEYSNGSIAQEWVFRTKPRWNSFSKVLDSNLTVNQNRIKENTVIICERVEPA